MTAKKSSPAPSLARRVAARAALVLERACVPSYSQEGEDRILWRIFERSAPGCYVDVGAHHPKRFSNTYLFYREGWSGITIDPDPDAAALFARQRPRDVHIQAGVSDQPGRLTYRRFDDSALNTFDARLADERERAGGYRALAPLEVEVATLASLLERQWPGGRTFELLSVDAEGFDLKVLRSNDWRAFRPRYVLAESLGSSLDRLEADPCCAFLRSAGYAPFAKTVATVFYRDEAPRR
jgi:FkbM family methyltransferase